MHSQSCRLSKEVAVGVGVLVYYRHWPQMFSGGFCRELLFGALLVITTLEYQIILHLLMNFRTIFHLTALLSKNKILQEKIPIVIKQHCFVYIVCLYIYCYQAIALIVFRRFYTDVWYSCTYNRIYIIKIWKVFVGILELAQSDTIIIIKLLRTLFTRHYV